MSGIETSVQFLKLTVEEVLQIAIGHHQSGKLQDAEKFYHSILQTQPNHPDANHNLGVLALQLKQPALALPYFKVALESNTSQRQYWLSYINAMIQTNQVNAAMQVLEQGRRNGLIGMELEVLAARLKVEGQIDPSTDQRIVESLPNSAVSGARIKSPKIRSKHGSKPRKKTVHYGREPNPYEINSLIALFQEGRYSEVATIAKKLTLRFPLHRFAWVVLGAALRQMGQNADALLLMKKVVELFPNDAETHNNMGNTYKDLGQMDNAKISYQQALKINPNFAEAYNNLGVTFWTLGCIGEAEFCYRCAIQVNPDYAEAYNNLGIILKDLDKIDEAEAAFQRALQIKPDYAEAHYNLGGVLQNLDRLEDAEVSYRRALQINPNFAESYNNLGNILKNMGRIEEAKVCYCSALQIKSDFVEAHNNLGTAYKDLDLLNEAAISYRRALQIKPECVEATNNLALLLNLQDMPFGALDIIKQSLKIKETEDAKRIFFSCIKRLRFTHIDEDIRSLMVRAMSEPWGRPNELAWAIIDQIKLNPYIGGCLSRAINNWPVQLSVQDLFGSKGPSPLSSDSLLCALLNTARICDIKLERFLTMARCAMLESAIYSTSSTDEIDKTLVFYSALARQCFINEYVFTHSIVEIQKAKDLWEILSAALEANVQIPALWLLAAAAYFPLYNLPLASRLLESEWPEEVKAVIVQQVCEPSEEIQLRNVIPRLTDIEDEVSLLVQSQYEENPYPRWVKAAPVGAAKNINEYLGHAFPLVSFKRHCESVSIDVLIAGCGTGQQSIETAQRIKGARVLAVDLSMASLSHALRKTRELGLSSIEYAQADLLKLETLDRSFDVIETSGVLVALANPFAGWKVLLSLLRPGGFMKLGLYSEVARRNIVRIRKFIDEQCYSSTADDIRRCRQVLMDLDEIADFGTTLKTPDFFSISTCRDLLFHVQEHRMTLARIDEFLRDNNLMFLGFEIEPHVLYAYKQRFPNDRAATNLAQWQTFENENPDTFFGMYQFWVQKA